MSYKFIKNGFSILRTIILFLEYELSYRSKVIEINDITLCKSFFIMNHDLLFVTCSLPTLKLCDNFSNLAFKIRKF